METYLTKKGIHGRRKVYMIYGFVLGWIPDGVSENQINGLCDIRHSPATQIEYQYLAFNINSGKIF